MFSIFKKSEPVLDSKLAGSLEKGATIIDVRTEGEFASGHAKSAMNIPLDTIEDKVEALKAYQQIVVCCRSGARSGQAKSILENYGFSNVINGGSWQNVNNHLQH